MIYEGLYILIYFAAIKFYYLLEINIIVKWVLKITNKYQITLT